MPGNSRQTIAGALLLLAGGAIGAGLGMLYAPQSGKKTRKKVVRYGRRVRGEVEEMGRRAADSVAEFVDEVGERSGKLVDRGSDAADEMRKNLLHAIEAGQKSLENQRKRLSKLWG